jgi:hypothetical protein
MPWSFGRLSCWSKQKAKHATPVDRTTKAAKIIHGKDCMSLQFSNDPIPVD